MTGDLRRQLILSAAKRCFARHGFAGTTTKSVAAAASISEGLLFKHFPTKLALYAEILAEECEADPHLAHLLGQDPSTATLVRIVHGFYAFMIGKRSQEASSDAAILARLMFRSLMEDGEFARLFIRRVTARLVSKLEACIAAASAAGDLDSTVLPHSLPGWFTHHLAITLMLHHLPDRPVFDYGVPRAKLIEEAVRFALRGIGLNKAAIRRHYPSEELTKTRR